MDRWGWCFQWCWCRTGRVGSDWHNRIAKTSSWETFSPQHGFLRQNERIRLLESSNPLLWEEPAEVVPLRDTSSLMEPPGLHQGGDQGHFAEITSLSCARKCLGILLKELVEVTRLECLGFSDIIFSDDNQTHRTQGNVCVWCDCVNWKHPGKWFQENTGKALLFSYPNLHHILRHSPPNQSFNPVFVLVTVTNCLKNEAQYLLTLSFLNQQLRHTVQVWVPL